MENLGNDEFKLSPVPGSVEDQIAKLWQWVTTFDKEKTETAEALKTLRWNSEQALSAHQRCIQGLQDRVRVLEEGGSTYDSLTTQQYVAMLDSATDDVVTAEMRRYAEARRAALEEGLREPEKGRFGESAKVSALLNEHLTRVA